MNESTKEVVEGTIFEFPSYRFTNNQYIIEDANKKTRILIYLLPYQKLFYKEHVVLSGTYKDVREDPEWIQYYKKQNVQYVMFYPKLIEHNKIQLDSYVKKIKNILFLFKMYIRSIVLENFSSRASALILGMLLGERDELSKNEKDIFNRSGISHILVVSGYNISLIISFFFIIFSFISRYLKVGISLIGVLCFVLLVGADDSVVRASIMGCILILAQVFNQKSNAIHTLFLAGCFMLIFDPITLFDIGFHLSFLATFILICMPNNKKIPEYVLTIVWIFIYMLPYTAYLSEKISINGIFSNICILFIVPIYMLLSFVSILLRIIHINVYIDQFLIECLTHYIFFITKVTEFIPVFSYQISKNIILVLYILYITIILFFKNRYNTKDFIAKHYQKFVPQKSN